MSEVSLDKVDRGILFVLQRDARNTTIDEIAAEVDVSPSTVRNRIDQMEDEGVIEGYYPKIDYEQANFPLHVLFICSAPPEEREEVAAEALKSRSVVDVKELLTGIRNLYIEVVALDTRDLTAITSDLSAMGFQVEASEIITKHAVRPWGEFEF